MPGSTAANRNVLPGAGVFRSPFPNPARAVTESRTGPNACHPASGFATGRQLRAESTCCASADSPRSSQQVRIVIQVTNRMPCTVVRVLSAGNLLARHTDTMTPCRTRVACSGRRAT